MFFRRLVAVVILAVLIGGATKAVFPAEPISPPAATGNTKEKGSDNKRPDTRQPISRVVTAGNTKMRGGDKRSPHQPPRRSHTMATKKQAAKSIEGLGSLVRNRLENHGTEIDETEARTLVVMAIRKLQPELVAQASGFEFDSEDDARKAQEAAEAAKATVAAD